jgi:hypothetical protein
MPKRILGSGWQFPIAIDGNKTVAVAYHEEKIKQSVFIILGTAKGERVMRPDFGCEIHECIFDVIDASTLTLIRFQSFGPGHCTGGVDGLDDGDDYLQAQPCTGEKLYQVHGTHGYTIHPPHPASVRKLRYIIKDRGG